MDSVTTTFLTGLSVEIASKIIDISGRKIRNILSDSERKKALTRCINSGLLAALSTTTVNYSGEYDILEEIFKSFFKEQDVVIVLSGLLKGNKLDIDELKYLFEDCGYDTTTLPEIKFADAMLAFEIAFISQSEEEAILKDVIQTRILKSQLKVQNEILVSFKKLIKFIERNSNETIYIENGQISSSLDKTTIVNFDANHLANMDKMTTKFLKHYLTAIHRLCEVVDVGEIDESFQQQNKLSDDNSLSLSDIFVPLRISNFSSFFEIPKHLLTKKAILHIEQEAELIQNEYAKSITHSAKIEDEIRKLFLVPLDAISAISKIKRSVIVGDPGSGKSSLVNHLCSMLSLAKLGSEISSHLKGWEKDQFPFPVRIILRRFAAWIPKNITNGSAGLVWNYIEHQASEIGCKETFPSLKIEIINNGIIFFDGIDEVRQVDEDKKRTIIQEAILQFSRTLDENRIVITSRPYAYNDKNYWSIPQSDFIPLKIEPFDISQIQDFTRKWYSAAGPNKGWSIEKCQIESNQLNKAIQSAPHLYRLATSPLLLILMVQMHGRDGYLPENRSDLYGKAVNLLLAHWENRIVVDVHGTRTIEPGLILQLGIRSDTLKIALERIAFEAHERQEKDKNRSIADCDIPKIDLLEELKSELKSLDRAEIVIDYVRKRAGLLIAKDNKTYSFPHRTFQEYMAAAFILKNGNYEELLKDLLKRDYSWWSEVFLLSIGISRTSPRAIADIIDYLIDDIDPSSVTGTPEKLNIIAIAAKSLIEVDFKRFVEIEKERGRFTKTLSSVQQLIIKAVCNNEKIIKVFSSPKLTNYFADLIGYLDDLEDVRFNSKLLFLPDDDLLGFIKISAGEFDKSTCIKMQGIANFINDKVKKLFLPNFYIAKYPVTINQFRCFLEDTNHQILKDGMLSGHGSRAVTGIRYLDAIAYCEWLNTKLKSRMFSDYFKVLDEQFSDQNWHISIPTEAEWEKSASGISNQDYDYLPNPIELSTMKKKVVDVVGVHPKITSGYGIYDMLRMSKEWTRTYLTFDINHNPITADTSIRKKASIEHRFVLKGGLRYSPEYLLNAKYGSSDFITIGADYSFRLVITTLLDQASSEL